MPLPTESRFSKFCCIYLRTHNQNAISNCDDANTQNYMTFLTFMLIQQYGNAMWCYSLRFVKTDILIKNENCLYIKMTAWKCSFILALCPIQISSLWHIECCLVQNFFSYSLIISNCIHISVYSNYNLF